MKINVLEKRKNLIKQQYLCSRNNYVVCIDTSQLGNQGFLFCGIDLAARNIIGHCFCENVIQGEDLVQALDKIVKDRDFLPQIKIIHSDRGALFKSRKYLEFTKENQIKISIGSSDGHSNQVIERTFRTLKAFLRKILNADWRNGMPDPLMQDKLDPSFIAESVSKAIQDYNNKPHKGIAGMTPNHMEEALFIQQNSTTMIDNQLVPYLARNDNSNNALAILDFKSKIIDHFYQNNWKQFFTDFRNETKKGINILADQNSELFKQNQNLFQQNLELKKSLTLVQNEIEIMREKRILKEENKLKRLNANKVQCRQHINQEEFFDLLKIIPKDNFVDCRKKAALILLYITGLRVSNLLYMKVKHMQEFFSKGQIVLPLIKKGNRNHLIAVSQKSQQLLFQFDHVFKTIMNNKSSDEFLFSTQVNFKKPINRSSFDQELNNVLQKGSRIFNKFFRTHSFRATLVTDFLVDTPIDLVKEIVGHKDIKTTLQYKRGNLNEVQLKQVLKQLDKTRYKDVLHDHNTKILTSV
jgi:integrase/recombinase XerD